MRLVYYQETKPNMAIQLIRNGVVTADVAAERSGYTPAYVRRLAARKLIVGTKHGHQWFIDLESLLEYKERADAEGKAKFARRYNDAPDN